MLTPCQLHSRCNSEACVDPDHAQHADDWFEDAGSGRGTPAGIRRRKAIQACWNDCPTAARLDCLDRGLVEHNLDHGVWGGYTETQRREIFEGLAMRKASRRASL